MSRQIRLRAGCRRPPAANWQRISCSTRAFAGMCLSKAASGSLATIANGARRPGIRLGATRARYALPGAPAIRRNPLRQCTCPRAGGGSGRRPRTLADLIEQARSRGETADAVVANVHALLLTAQIRPVYRPTPEAAESARKLQGAIRARAHTAEAIGYLPSAAGTAFAVPVADQMFMEQPPQTSAEALSAAAAVRVAEQGHATTGVLKPQLVRRARAYKRAIRHYAALGLMPG